MPFSLVPRAFVFEKCVQLGQHVRLHQQVMFDPESDYVVEGEEIFLEAGDTTPTRLTKEQAYQFNIAHAAYSRSMWDDIPDVSINGSFFEGIIAELKSPSFDIFIDNIGPKLMQLAEALSWEEIFVISDSKRPYLAQKNSYKDVKNATDKLLEMGLSRTTHEGVVLKEKSIRDFFSTIFWIVRCNATAPGICFSSPNSKTVGTLCKYGNIHFDCFDRAEAENLKNALKSVSFREAQNNICNNNFTGPGAITGREIIME